MMMTDSTMNEQTDCSNSCSSGHSNANSTDCSIGPTIDSMNCATNQRCAKEPSVNPPNETEHSWQAQRAYSGSPRIVVILDHQSTRCLL
jgi:hypothetical protein